MEALSTIVLGIMGVIMAVKPQKIIKPAVLEDPSRVKLIRVLGGFVAVCSVIGLIFLVGASY